MFRKFEKKSAPLLGPREFVLRVLGTYLIVLGVTVFYWSWERLAILAWPRATGLTPSTMPR